MSNLYGIQFECVGGTRLELATYSFAEEKKLNYQYHEKRLKTHNSSITAIALPLS